MDVSFNNVLEGTRQYFLGLPTQAQADGIGQPVWPTSAPTPGEGQSGAPAASSRPPSAAAAPPTTPMTMVTEAPPRPPSEPIEPEPHIIHKATVMREAAEKRGELPEPDDEDESVDGLSPPTHIIHRPSSIPAPAGPRSSPIRPPSGIPLQPNSSDSILDPPTQYHPPVHRVQTPTVRPADFTPGRPPDPHSVSRPPELYPRYHYDTSGHENNKGLQGPLLAPLQPSVLSRHTPQLSYARKSVSIPQHSTPRFREAIVHSPPTPRYPRPPQQPLPPPPHNDRVPPIYHPQTVPPQQKLSSIDGSTSQLYPNVSQRRETPCYSRIPSHCDRQPLIPPRKYDPQQSYPGYRPSHSNSQHSRLENHQYKRVGLDVTSAHYPGKSSERVTAGLQSNQQDMARLPPRIDYPTINRNMDGRNSLQYHTPSTSNVRYVSNTSIPNSVTQPRPVSRTSSVKASCDYTHPNSFHSSHGRSGTRPAYPNQQTREKVAVTTLVSQWNEQSKQKRDSPLDLSVKTVKNSADSSTTQDEAVVDSATVENKSMLLQHKPHSSNRHISQPTTSGHVGSHKVDFTPDFTRNRERGINHYFASPSQSSHMPGRYNGTYETSRSVPESFPTESHHQLYPELDKNAQVGRNDYISRLNVPRSHDDDRFIESRVRDDRNFFLEDRKRPGDPIINNIPDKLVKCEVDKRSDRLSREQHELMRHPVFSYTDYISHETQQRTIPSEGYLGHHVQGRYSYPNKPINRESSDFRSNYHERNKSTNSRRIIQTTRDRNPHHLDPQTGVPADKRVLLRNILRSSLEKKQIGHTELNRREIPDLIVIDDVDDTVIEIIDDNDSEVNIKDISKPLKQQVSSTLNHHIQMPKAVDSILKESEYHGLENTETKSKSPENDVASRIRTKAELKVMPPPQDNRVNTEPKEDLVVDKGSVKLLPKSQKQHLFNQIREENLRLESVIKSEKSFDLIKTEPINIDDIEKDAEVPIKTENVLENPESKNIHVTVDIIKDDLDWVTTCDNFMEQLKTGCHKKKMRRNRLDTFENDRKSEKSMSTETLNSLDPEKHTVESTKVIIIKEEPLDEHSIEDKLEISKESDLKDKYQNATISLGKLNIEDKNTETQDSQKPLIEPFENNFTDSKSNQNVSVICINSKEKTVNNKIRKNVLSGRLSVSEESHQNLENKITKNKNKAESVETINVKDKCEVVSKSKLQAKTRVKIENGNSKYSAMQTIKKKSIQTENIRNNLKEESESTDDDEPLIKSKLLKEKEQSERLRHQLLKDLSEKSAIVKLECFDVDLTRNIRKSIDFFSKDKDDKLSKGKNTKAAPKLKNKSLLINNSKTEKQKDSSSDSDDDELSVARRLRIRKNIKNEENKDSNKSPSKTPSKRIDNNNSTSTRKPGFGDGSAFHPGWEEELYRYKRSLRMPTRLIAIPRGRSGGPFVKGSIALFSRGSTSLPDLDPPPLSPAPSSAPSIATDDLFSRRPDKQTLDSDLDSNSSCSVANRLHYDSEASTSTVLSSSNIIKKSSSIVDILIQKCGKREDSKKKVKDKDEKSLKTITKNSNTLELLPTPNLGGVLKTGNKGSANMKTEKLMEDLLFTFRKETVAAYKTAFNKTTEGLIGTTEDFSSRILKCRTKTETRVLKQRVSIKEIFGDERPASCPPSALRNDDPIDSENRAIGTKKELEVKPKLKPKKIVKGKFQRRSGSIRDGLRSTQSLKRNDAKGRLLRLKKRNNIMKSIANKRIKDTANHRCKKENSPLGDKDKPKQEASSLIESEGITKRRFKRLFGRRKFSSGFDYIRKKKKIIRREEHINKVRRPAVKPSPESVNDIQKEVKGWFINKSIGETHLHRAARLGYTDCVAYCLEKMEADPSAKDNAGFTPLHVAAAKGHVRIARLLLQYGADVSAAAQGGIRPLHEACENCHVEVIRLLLAYGADPLLVTYADQTPEELAEGPSALLLRLHIADVQGRATEPWRFPPPTNFIDREELGCDPLCSPPPGTPPPPIDSTIEIQCSEAPLPPFYSLRAAPGQPGEGLWCLLQDVTNLLQIKSKESLLKQIHCGSGNPKDLFQEIRTQDFLERAQCHQLLCAGEKVNVRASKVGLVRVTDKLRQLLKVETVLVS